MKIPSHDETLSHLRPELAAELHPDNSDMGKQVTLHSNKKLKWACSFGHVWIAAVGDRTRNPKCPKCAQKSRSIAVRKPGLVKELHPEDKHYAKTVSSGSEKALRWICQEPTCRYEYVKKVCAKPEGRGCPACAGLVITENNTLQARFPEVASELHPKDAHYATEVTPGSSLKVRWVCKETDCSHSWSTRIAKRTAPKNASGCPACAGIVVTEKNCLLAKRPEIAEQLHPDDYERAKYVTSGSGKRLRWICGVESCSHVWVAPVATRSLGRDCPACSGKVTTEKTCLKAVRPDIAKELHPDNANLAEILTAHSNKRVKWLCPIKTCNHVYETKVTYRVDGSNCPSCSGRTATQSNCLATLRPDIAKQLHPDNAQEAWRVTLGVEKRLKWVCPKPHCHHVYIRQVSLQVQGHECPACTNRQLSSHNCLANQCPQLANELHPDDMHYAHKLTTASSKILRWKCDFSTCLIQYYETSIPQRMKGIKCGVCNGSWFMATARMFLLRTQDEWENATLCERNLFFTNSGLLHSKGRARTLIGCLIGESSFPIDFFDYLEGRSAPETEALVASHRKIKYGLKQPIPKALRRHVLQAKGNFCHCCGSKERIQLDHKIPEIRGGFTSFENLQPLCIHCNTLKGIRVVTLKELRALKHERDVLLHSG